MKITDFTRKEIDEVAMNPTAYAQSLEVGERRGVLVGYEFEVCVPEETIKGGGKPAADKDSMAWMRNVPSAWYEEVDIDDMVRLKSPVEFNDNQYDDMAQLMNAYFSLKVAEPTKKAFEDLPERLRKLFIKRWKKLLNDSRRSIINSPYTFYQYCRSWLATLKYDAPREDRKMYERLFDSFVVAGRSKPSEKKFLVDVFGSYKLQDLITNPSLDFSYLEEYYDENFDDDYGYDSHEQDYYGAAKVLEPALKKSFGEVKVFDSYHERKKDTTSWYIEPDGSLEPTNEGDGAAEVVSPPMPANTAIDALKKFYGIAGQLKLYTNQSTGLHINVSVPDNLDILKLAVFVGDQYVLKSWGREDNQYAQSVIQSLQQNRDVIGLDVKHKPNLVLLQKIAKDIAGDHYASTSYNGKWVSFRHTGGDYLKDMTSVLNVVGRFVRAMVIASDPNAYRKEYLTKLTTLVGTKEKPTGYSYSDIAKLKQSPVEVVVTLMYGIPNGITPEKMLKGYKKSLADMNSNLLSKFIPLSPELTKILTDKWYNTVYNSVKETTKSSLDRNGHTRNAIIWNSGSRKEDLTITAVYDGARWDPRRLGLQVSPKITLKPGTPEHTEYVNSIIQQYKNNRNNTR